MVGTGWVATDAGLVLWRQGTACGIEGGSLRATLSEREGTEEGSEGGL